MSNHPTIFAYTKIFFSLRHNQIHVQNHVVQGQPSQAIPLSIARYKKAVYSGLWVQVTLVAWYVPSGIAAVALTPQLEGWLYPLTIYCYFSLFKLVIKPVPVLLEDQGSKASCKKNVKATILSIELVYYGFQLKILHCQKHVL